jgi:hypothetical protein
VLCLASKKSNGVIPHWAEVIGMMVIIVQEKNGEILVSQLNYGEGN